MKYKLPLAIFIFLLTMNMSQAQTNCNEAVARLYSYAGQVNKIYYDEYWTVIPLQRCPEFDAWRRPYPPAVVQNCRNQMLWNLNTWYGQQVNLVNNWYIQIVRGCTQSDPNTIRRTGPGTVEREGQADPIDDDEIDDLTAGIDEEKAVRITIPKTAAGFRPR